MAVLRKLKFRNKTYYPYQIVNNKYYYKKDGIIVEYEIRAAVGKFYYVDGEDAFINKNAEVNEQTPETLKLTSLLSFDVKEEDLVINSI